MAKIFVNVSNHPSERWSEEQKAAALAFGCDKIRDIPFPNVPPEANIVAVDELAYKLFRDILEINPTAVMVQGEATLVYTLVRRLQIMSIPAYAATTERKVIEIGNEKRSVFNFVQFRRYF